MIRIDLLIVVKFLPPSNKQLRTHGKNFQGSHASGTAPESCLVNHEADTSLSHKHRKRLERSPRVSPRIKSLAGHRNSNGSTTLYIRSKLSEAKQMVADIHRSSDGGLDVRNPCALELADRVL